MTSLVLLCVLARLCAIRLAIRLNVPASVKPQPVKEGKIQRFVAAGG